MELIVFIEARKMTKPEADVDLNKGLCPSKAFIQRRIEEPGIEQRRCIAFDEIMQRHVPLMDSCNKR